MEHLCDKWPLQDSQWTGSLIPCVSACEDLAYKSFMRCAPHTGSPFTYSRPRFEADSPLVIVQGRHPVVENLEGITYQACSASHQA